MRRRKERMMERQRLRQVKVVWDLKFLMQVEGERDATQGRCSPVGECKREWIDEGYRLRRRKKANQGEDEL